MTAQNPHGEPSCPKPRASKRKWRNTVWVCPDCGQGYTTRYSTDIPGRTFGAWSGRCWDWWQWPLGDSGRWDS